MFLAFLAVKRNLEKRIHYCFVFSDTIPALKRIIHSGGDSLMTHYFGSDAVRK